MFSRLQPLVMQFAQLFAEPLHTARNYSLLKFRADLLAGLTVSVVEVPQAMAYAVIAGVPPEYGIYASIIQGILGALLSSGEHLATGPTNTQSLLIASAVTRIVGDPGDPSMYLELVFGLTLLKGVIQLCFAAAKMGELVRYVSKSVIVGVAAGAGILIVVGQLPYFLGMPLEDVANPLPGVTGQIQRMWPHLGEVNMHALTLGGVALSLIIGIRFISRLLPGALIAVIVSAVAVWMMGWTSNELALIPPMPRSLPELHVPRLSFSDYESLLGGALALALLGMLESVAIVKSIATKSGERIRPNQEFFAQGLTNAVAGFFQCIPGSGSFTRSALDHAAGGKTRFAAVYNACFVAFIFIAAGSLAGYIPLAALAAVLFVIAYSLIDWRYIIRLFRSSIPDATVCVITLLATLFAPLEYAIYIGIFLNLALYLRQASRLHIAEMVQSPTGQFQEQPVQDRAGKKRVVFLSVEGDLFFAVADELQERLSLLLAGEVRVVIIRLKRTHSIDATILDVLERFTSDLQNRGGHVILCGVKPELMEHLKAFGLLKRIGKENVFETTQGVFTSAKMALRRAGELLKHSLDTQEFDRIDETEGWAYEI